MVAAKEWQPRGSWRPKKKTKKTKKSSYYEFFNWSWPQPGVRGDPVRSRDQSSAELIRTTYFNQATCTHTLHTLAFDLDVDKADRRWIKDSKLDFEKIRAFLAENEPVLNDAITEIVSSTSGRGLGIAIAVSPSDMSRKSSRKYLRLCRVAQCKIIEILNYYGMGADPNARGLKREMPNFRSPSRTLFANQIRRRRVDSHGIPVVTELLRYANQHPVFKSNEYRLWPHFTTERKLAKLYMHLESQGGFCSGSRAEILGITGLSIATFYKVMKCPPQWLYVNYLGKSSGYSFWLVDEGAVSLERRAKDLLANRVGPKTFEPFEDVPEPALVQQGERNRFITDISLRLKWLGWTCDDALELMGSLIARIPGNSTSASCRHYAKKVESVFRNMPEYRKETSLPNWLERLISLQRKECTKNPKKGGTPVAVASPPKARVEESCYRKVGFDQRIRFKGSFYSVPREFVREQVSVSVENWAGARSVVIRRAFDYTYHGSYPYEKWPWFLEHRGPIIAKYTNGLRSGIVPEHYQSRELQLVRMTDLLRYMFRDYKGLADSLLTKLRLCSMPLLGLRSCYALSEALKNRVGDCATIVAFSDHHKETVNFARYINNIVRHIKFESTEVQR